MRSRPWKFNFTLRSDVQLKGARMSNYFITRGAHCHLQVRDRSQTRDACLLPSWQKYYYHFIIESPLDRPIESLIHLDCPIKICHVFASCQLLKASKNPRTNQRLTNGSWCHVNQSLDYKGQFLTLDVGFINGTNQLVFDTWHISEKWHVAFTTQ
jgi:hypothetical protein